MPPTETDRTRIFFVPLAYFIETRLSGWTGMVSWIAIYPVPITLAAAIFRFDPVDLPLAIALLLSMLATYGLYELGYMDNDTRTAAREARPTERLSRIEKAQYARRQRLIIVLRLAFVVALVVGVHLLVEGNADAKQMLLVGLVLIALVFPTYNSTRGRINLPLHFLLVCARFCTPGIVLVEWGYEQFLATMVLAFPVINLLERSGEKRYGLSILQPLYQHRDRTRVVYYGLLTLGAGALWAQDIVGLQPAIVFGYFLLYRIVALMVAQRLGPREGNG